MSRILESAYRVAIIGSRHFANLGMVEAAVARLYQEHGSRLMIVSGGAKGVDATAERKAREMAIPYLIYPANWERDGRGAGHIRNHYIIGVAHEVLAFWDGESRGTQGSIDLAVSVQKALTVFDKWGQHTVYEYTDKGSQLALPSGVAEDGHGGAAAQPAS